MINQIDKTREIKGYQKIIQFLRTNEISVTSLASTLNSLEFVDYLMEELNSYKELGVKIDNSQS